MAWFLTKVLISSVLISFCAWLAGRFPQVSGFIIAMPLTTLLALAFAHQEHHDPARSVTFAKSVFAGIPVSLLFFVPFLFAERLRIGFWTCYFSGLVLLGAGYALHKVVVRTLI